MYLLSSKKKPQDIGEWLDRILGFNLDASRNNLWD